MKNPGWKRIDTGLIDAITRAQQELGSAKRQLCRDKEDLDNLMKK